MRALLVGTLTSVMFHSRRQTKLSGDMSAICILIKHFVFIVALGQGTLGSGVGVWGGTCTARLLRASTDLAECCSPGWMHDVFLPPLMRSSLLQVDACSALNGMLKKEKKKTLT